VNGKINDYDGSAESNLRFWVEHVRGLEVNVEQSRKNHEDLVRLLIGARKSQREAEQIVKSKSRED
jgi:hypothetical protein